MQSDWEQALEAGARALAKAQHLGWEASATWSPEFVERNRVVCRHHADAVLRAALPVLDRAQAVPRWPVPVLHVVSALVGLLVGSVLL